LEFGTHTKKRTVRIAYGALMDELLLFGVDARSCCCLHILAYLETLHEAINLASGVQNALFAGVERVAL
jgi:hypothetical protein